jgi:hypothetical protein
MTFCTPCTAVPSEAVALGPVPSGQTLARAQGRRARSSEVRGCCRLVWLWFRNLGGSRCHSFPAAAGGSRDRRQHGRAGPDPR